MAPEPPPKGPPVRKPAPHVQAAVQPKAVAGPPAKPAPHVQAALQPKAAPAPPVQPAPHVQKMVAVAQARMPPSPTVVWSPAPHVQACLKAPAPAGARPPAGPPRAARLAGAVQPYTETTISGKSGRLSQNGNYFVTGGELYAKTGATAPQACNATIDTISRKQYTKFEGGTLFLKDCLHTAEELLAGKHLKYGAGVASVSRETGADIGNSEADNISAAQSVATSHAGKVNDSADPAVGEAYLIVETSKVMTYPYHAAAVVAVDGSDRVTLEMFAGSTDAKDEDRKYPGKFAMYGGAGQSFHDEYKSAFSTPVTIVIKKK